VISVGAVGGT